MALPNESDMEDGDDAQQVTSLLQKPSSNPRRRSPWLVPVVCLVATGVLALASSPAKAAMTTPAKARPNGVTLLAEDAPAEIARIKWASHPDRCVIVRGGEKGSAGAVPELWECSGAPGTFIVPAPGAKGPIKWAAHPHLCLDAPRGSELQLWDCAQAPAQNIDFVMPEGGSGPIRLAARPGRCISVPPSDKRNGLWLNMGDCDADADAGVDDASASAEDANASAEDGPSTGFRIVAAAHFADGKLASTSCTVQNLDHDKLSAKEALKEQFDKAAKDGISTAVGGGTTPGQVALTTSSGAQELAGKSVNIDAVIALEKEASGTKLESGSDSSDAMAQALTKKFNAWSDIDEVSLGPISIFCKSMVVHK